MRQADGLMVLLMTKDDGGCSAPAVVSEMRGEGGADTRPLNQLALKEALTTLWGGYADYFKTLITICRSQVESTGAIQRLEHIENMLQPLAPLAVRCVFVSQ